MDGDPVLVNPEDTVCFIALGSAGAVFQDYNNQDEVLKVPLKHVLEGCSEQVAESVRNKESFSKLLMH